MAQGRKQGCYWLGWVLVLGVGATAVDDAQAQQVLPDTTLQRNSVVTVTGNNFTITGGTPVGGNLFHSFSQFSVPTNGEAFFNNASTVQNIISRVTGSQPSNIDGILRANSKANLFLLNPNGIIFGPNASLNVGGSFVTTTANAIQFGNQGFFSASVANDPSPLLTVNPSALLFNQITAASIQNNSVTGLGVPNGQSLLLVGGNITMNGGRLNAVGGRVELGGLTGAGTVGLLVNDNNLSLSFPDGVARGDVSLTNGAIVDVRRATEKAGDISINAGSVSVTSGARLDASTSGTGDAGNITIIARDTVSFDGVGNLGSSLAFSNVALGTAGKGGDITINTGSLSVTNGARLDASTSGTGDAGNVKITARDRVSFDGVGSNGASSFAFSSVGAGATGKGGNLSIDTGSLSVTNGARLDASTSGTGDAGSIIINARDTVSFDGVGSNGGSVAFSNVGAGAIGKGGTLSINAGSLFVTKGAALDASTSGTGNAGNININTASQFVTNDAKVHTRTLGQGNGGIININTGSLSVTNGAQIDVSTSGTGDAGNVNITARDTVSFDGVGKNGSSAAFSNVGAGAAGKGGDININTGSLSVTDGARLDASSSGPRDAGNVTITARDRVSFDGVGSNQTSSYAFSNVGAGAAGKGGDININTGSLSVTNGARLDASTSGTGDAGNVKITAHDTVSFDGVGSNGASSFAFSSVGSGATGKGGDININTGSLSVTNGARLDASTSGPRDAGNINITARDTVSFDGVGSNGSSSSAFSSVAALTAGKGGDININTGSLSVTNGARLDALTNGKGNAGNVKITARDTVSFVGVGSNENSSVAFSSVESPEAEGKGGTLSINTGSLSLRDGAQLISRTLGRGDAGNISITARDTVSFDGVSSNRSSVAFSSVESGATGKGGGISITADSLSLRDGAQLNANSLGQGTAGNIEVRSRSIDLDNKATLTATSSLGKGGDIQLIVTDLLLLRRGSEITTTAGTPGAGGDGGNISIETPLGLIVAIPTEDSHIRANAFQGKGGTVNINTSGVFGFLINPARQTRLSDITASSDLGPQGVVTINTPDVDPSRGVSFLPTKVVDPALKIASGCPGGDGTTGNEFIVTGRGGLPPTPYQPLSNDVVWSDTRLTNVGKVENLKVSVPIHSHPKAREIVPATGWVFNGKGEVTLISGRTNVYPSNSPTSACHAK
ncbi:MAG: filamentous hemagglutinin N-terminal domain-containing protein [Stigonema ocellatum SAG 48.90 = DSM 106950]|nr:filamentous hemagglutinin N-terminal domain-containing protein [Stigonema ocellatum SAG 48.90 = DSM 106950]